MRKSGISEKQKKQMVRIMGIVVLLCACGIFGAGNNRVCAEKNYDYTVTNEEFEVDGTDELSDAAGIQRALSKAVGEKKEIMIYFPKGTYYIDKPLRIYSNTHLVLDKQAVIDGISVDNGTVKLISENIARIFRNMGFPLPGERLASGRKKAPLMSAHFLIL